MSRIAVVFDAAGRPFSPPSIRRSPMVAAPTGKEGSALKMLKLVEDAFADISAGWRNRSVALAFASEDVADLYRRTRLGPVWLILSFLVFVASIVFVVGGVSGIPHYLAFVACGLLVYNLMSEVLAESSNLFQREMAFIKGTTLPISIYVMRLTSRTLIRNIYPLAGALGLTLLDGVIPSPAWLYAALGLVLIIVAIPAVAMVFAILGVLFADTHFILQNLLRLAFFLTPVFWDHAGDRIRIIFYYWNPFTHFITIVRSPILTGDPALQSWIIAGGISLAAWILAIVLLGQFRRRIVFMI